jgi:hypothetical protein
MLLASPILLSPKQKSSKKSERFSYLCLQSQIRIPQTGITITDPAIIPQAPATVLGNAGVVFGHDLTTEAALTKLSFLLAVKEVQYDDLVQQMQVSIRGEMTEIHGTQFSHPSTDIPSLTEQQSAFTALGYAITMGELDVVTQMLGMYFSEPSVSSWPSQSIA